MASSQREQYNAMIGGDWTEGQWKFDGRVSYARGEVQNDEKNSTATIFGVPRLGRRLHRQRRRS